MRFARYKSEPSSAVSGCVRVMVMVMVVVALMVLAVVVVTVVLWPLFHHRTAEASHLIVLGLVMDGTRTVLHWTHLIVLVVVVDGTRPVFRWTPVDSHNPPCSRGIRGGGGGGGGSGGGGGEDCLSPDVLVVRAPLPW